MDRQTEDRLIGRLRDKQEGMGQASRQADRQTDKQASRKACRLTYSDRQASKHGKTDGQIG